MTVLEAFETYIRWRSLQPGESRPKAADLVAVIDKVILTVSTTGLAWFVLDDARRLLKRRFAADRYHGALSVVKYVRAVNTHRDAYRDAEVQFATETM